MTDEDKAKSEPGKAQCSCVTDPFSILPPELMPRPKNIMGGLRKVTCPACGARYWTNRDTELCTHCEKKGVRPPEAGAQEGE